jgi:hypothetical protein
VRASLAASDRLARHVLSDEERPLLRRALTLKRRAELVAGRVCAKLVGCHLRAAAGLFALPWTEAAVSRPDGGPPLCRWSDGIVQPVSIAHGGPLAVALGTPFGGRVGIDIEPATRRLDRAIPGLFSPLERLQIDSDARGRRCWTLREAWGKAAGAGVAAYFESVTTLRAGGRDWLVVPREGCQGDAALVVAAGEGPVAALAVVMSGRSGPVAAGAAGPA